MSIRSRLLAALAASAALVAASSGTAAAAAPFKVATNGVPLVLTIYGQETWNGQLLNQACIDSTPAVTITALPSASTAPTVWGQLQAVWLPSNTLQLPGFAGARIDVPSGGTLTVDPPHVFDWETGGSGLIQSVPVGKGPGRGTLWISAYGSQKIGGLPIQVFSNTVRIGTTVRKGVVADCPYYRRVLLPT